MTAPWWAGAIVPALVCLLTLVVYFMPPARPRLREFAPLPREASPHVSIILPARNEAHNIERCLGSLLASDYPGFDVIVVDDRSSDGTGAVAARVAAGDPRVRIIAGSEPPAGWYGKPWACWEGYRQSTGELLLFTDADTQHAPSLLSRAVGARAALNADLFTIMPRQEMIGFWERVAQPYFFLMIGLRYGSLQRINRNTNPRHGIANGQFILVTRASYQKVGGHQAVQDTVLDDLMMAVRYLEAGCTTRFVNAEEDMTTRMYSSLPGIVEGWSKNFFMGALSTFRSVPLAWIGILFGLTMPLVSLTPTAALLAGLVTGAPALLTFGVTGYLAASLFWGQFLRTAKAPMWYALFHPLGAAVQAYVLLRSAIRGTGHIEWKGRSYSHP